ncbi:hypothetical protein PENTCL1PPCAC_13886, partial [Pristionchus entomophagus]
SMVSARQFDPHDPRYYQCCCGARVHVSAMAKAVAGVCIVANVFNIWNAVANGTSLAFIVGGLFGSGLMAVAAFQEHRPTLIFYLVLQGLGIAAFCMMLFLTFVALVIFKVNVPQGELNYVSTSDASPALLGTVSAIIRPLQLKNRAIQNNNEFASIPARELGILVVLVFVFQLGLFLWSFAVMLHFYTFLSDRERAGAVPVVYQTRPAQQQQQQQTTGGSSLLDPSPVLVPNGIVSSAHYTFCCRPGFPPEKVAERRSSSFLVVDQAQPTFPSAPSAQTPPKIVCDDDPPPPPYETIHEKKAEGEKEKED